MDKQFMAEYFEKHYDDPIFRLVAENAEYEELREEYSRLESELLEKVGDLESPLWQLYEKIIDQRLAMEVVSAKLAFIAGAEERDKMMK